MAVQVAFLHLRNERTKNIVDVYEFDLMSFDSICMKTRYLQHFSWKAGESITANGQELSDWIQLARWISWAPLAMSAMSCTEIMSLSDMKKFSSFVAEGSEVSWHIARGCSWRAIRCIFLTKSYRIIAGGISATRVVGIPWPPSLPENVLSVSQWAEFCHRFNHTDSDSSYLVTAWHGQTFSAWAFGWPYWGTPKWVGAGRVSCLSDLSAWSQCHRTERHKKELRLKTLTTEHQALISVLVLGKWDTSGVVALIKPAAETQKTCFFCLRPCAPITMTVRISESLAMQGERERPVTWSEV